MFSCVLVHCMYMYVYMYMYVCIAGVLAHVHDKPTTQYSTASASTVKHYTTVVTLRGLDPILSCLSYFHTAWLSVPLRLRRSEPWRPSGRELGEKQEAEDVPDCQSK